MNDERSVSSRPANTWKLTPATYMPRIVYLDPVAQIVNSKHVPSASAWKGDSDYQLKSRALDNLILPYQERSSFGTQWKRSRRSVDAVPDSESLGNKHLLLLKLWSRRVTGMY
jgi:hypothetical protein